LGIVVAFIWAFGLGLIVFKLISATIGLRVTPEEEMAGLDLSEHHAEAYPDFNLTDPGVPANSAAHTGNLAPVNPQIEQRS
jgi:Amt family ammonium transporter